MFCIDATLFITLLYSYPLIGVCSPPKPQGPFSVKVGSYRKVNFKNPFKTAKTITIVMRPECFYTTTSTIEVEAKRQTRILISIEPMSAEEAASGFIYPRTGKMILKCEDDSGEIVQWTFYLEEEVGVGGAISSEKSSKLSVSTSKSARSSRSMRSNTSTKSSLKSSSHS